jgi:hypothetical protein
MPNYLLTKNITQVMMHSPSPPLVSQNQDGILSALNNTIETVKIVEGLVPLAIAKDVLSTVASILSVIRVRLQPFLFDAQG